MQAGKKSTYTVSYYLPIFSNLVWILLLTSAVERKTKQNQKTDAEFFICQMKSHSLLKAKDNINKAFICHKTVPAPDHKVSLKKKKKKKVVGWTIPLPQGRENITKRL